MGLGELLDAIRADYAAQLTAVMDELKQRPGVQVVSEAALRDEQGEVVKEGDLQLPMRIDVVALCEGAEPDTLSVDSQEMVEFEPVAFDWSDGLRLTLHPFSWDALSIRVPGTLSRAACEPLVQWFFEWFRADEDGEGQLLGAVHFLSDPEHVAGSVRFNADLGSAPVEAFEALLDAVALLGVTEAVVGDEQ